MDHKSIDSSITKNNIVVRNQRPKLKVAQNEVAMLITIWFYPQHDVFYYFHFALFFVNCIKKKNFKRQKQFCIYATAIMKKGIMALINLIILPLFETFFFNLEVKKCNQVNWLLNINNFQVRGHKKSICVLRHLPLAITFLNRM